MLSQRKKHFKAHANQTLLLGNNYDASHLNVRLAGNVGLPQFVAPVLPLQTPMGVKWPSNPVGTQTAFVCLIVGNQAIS